MLALHRVRSLLVRERTALMNPIAGSTRGLWNRGCARNGALRQALAIILEDRDNGMSALMRELFAEMSERLRLFEEHLEVASVPPRSIRAHFRMCRRRRDGRRAQLAVASSDRRSTQWCCRARTSARRRAR